MRRRLNLLFDHGTARRARPDRVVGHRNSGGGRPAVCCIQASADTLRDTSHRTTAPCASATTPSFHLCLSLSPPVSLFLPFCPVIRPHVPVQLPEPVARPPCSLTRTHRTCVQEAAAALGLPAGLPVYHCMGDVVTPPAQHSRAAPARCSALSRPDPAQGHDDARLRLRGIRGPGHELPLHRDQRLGGDRPPRGGGGRGRGRARAV